MRNLSYTLFRDSELLPILLVCGVCFVLISLVFHFLKERNIQKPKRKKSSLSFVRTSVPSPSLTKKDFYLMSVITLMYAIVSFWRLGSMKFPVTTWQPASDHTQIILETQSGEAFDAIYALYNEGDNNSNPDNYQLGFHDIEVEGSEDMDSWQALATLEGKGIFEWKIFETENNYRYIRLTSSSKDDTMTEFALRKADHSGFVPLSLVSVN